MADDSLPRRPPKCSICGKQMRAWEAVWGKRWVHATCGDKAWSEYYAKKATAK